MLLSFLSGPWKNFPLSASRIRATLGEVGVQAHPPAGSRTVSVRQSGGETPREPAAGTAPQERGIYAASPRAFPKALKFPNAGTTSPSPIGWERAGVRASQAAFTIIEIALCLGIIAFALVAIIGALPTGLNVQKNNREQTIIGQDATVMLDAIRSGSMGYDDLTNYVVAITNFWTTYTYNGNPSQPASPLYGFGGGTSNKSGVDWYTFSNSSVTGFYMTNGATIIGLLSIPTWTPVFNRLIHTPPPTSNYQSNYIVAYFRSMSGAEVDKAPQNNPTVLQDAFTYRMIVQNFPYAAVDTNGFCMECAQTNALTSSNQWVYRTNAAYTQWLLETNTHEFRLLFRWPVLPNGQIPNYGRYTFREMVDGQLTVSNYPNGGPPDSKHQWLYYVQPSVVYSQVPSVPGPGGTPQRISPQ